MLTSACPKLPMRNKTITSDYYVNKLGFKVSGDYGDYLILTKDQIEIHFFEFKALDPKTNYGQVYIRVKAIDEIYQSFIKHGVEIHPNGPLEIKPWRQKEFALLDPDFNLLTFGEQA
ncbi:VOC family protein [Pedobacter sp. HX-22-1]|uniref:Bleomycin resistance protein n=2 Tax=Pedobacter puniceum TaxID=2666136 RepID=A0A7K0FJU2_9SPHI|nr:VOC family protein [Pedobacter puniceum]